MHTRQNELNKWLKNTLENKPFTLAPLAGDASFRQYYRLYCDERSYVVMDAPPDKEAIDPFIKIGNLLAINGVHTPAILAAELTQGFILLEDLGDQMLLGALSHANANDLYTAAMTTLLRIQQCPTNLPQLPDFDSAYMLKELALFHEWFLKAYLELILTTKEELLLVETFDWLTAQISTQPQLFIHRDYHSRNLMLVNPKNSNDIGVIDFQDAMRGPITYDLVSLLKDCYVQWPREQVIQWLTYFYNNLPTTHSWTLMDFIRAFDLCGLQRHLKVLGIFCRLHLRDHKAAYLRDLPLTFNYVNACTESYPELRPFFDFMQTRVYQPFAAKCPL